MDGSENGLASQIQVLQDRLNTEKKREKHLYFSKWKILAKKLTCKGEDKYDRH